MKNEFDSLIANKDVLDISEYACQNFLDEYKYGDEDELNNLSKAINIEKSILTVYSNWFRISNKFYYFKRKFCFEEILMSEIFKIFGVKNVEFKIVKNNGQYGIISENYRLTQNKYYRFDNFIGVNMPVNLEILKTIIAQKTSNIDGKNIYEMIAKIIAIDIMFGQKDREYHNIFFEESAVSTSLGPMFDNGMIELNESKDRIIYDSCFDSLELRIDHLIKSTAKKLEENHLIVKYLNNALNFNLSKIIKMIEEKYSLDIPVEIVKGLNKSYDNNRFITEKTLKLIR